MGGSMVKDQLRELCNILLGVVKQEQDCLMRASTVQEQLCEIRNILVGVDYNGCIII